MGSRDYTRREKAIKALIMTQRRLLIKVTAPNQRSNVNFLIQSD